MADKQIFSALLNEHDRLDAKDRRAVTPKVSNA
jgi:hypothetical protein